MIGWKNGRLTLTTTGSFGPGKADFCSITTAPGGFGLSLEGFTLSLGAVGFPLDESEPSDEGFSPHPTTSSAANSRTIPFIAPGCTRLHPDPDLLRDNF